MFPHLRCKLLAAGLLPCLLLTMGCSKNSATPAPALDGRWSIQTQTLFVHVSLPSGTVTNTAGPFTITGRYRAEISADSIIYIRANVLPEYRANAFAYTRQGNTLRNRLTGQEVEIKELTDHSLTLYFKNSVTPGGTQDEEDHFTR